MNRHLHILAIATIALFGAVAQPALAADTTPPAAPAAADPLGSARALIAENRWVAAIEELQRINRPQDADWNNLMGYSHRKARTPDFAAAERYYDAALKIDPKHRGALEYSGELFLMMGDLARAEQRVAALESACRFGCEELKDLRKAVAAFKANGNKVAARP
jgi:Flp pilus assembly protein TadD